MAYASLVCLINTIDENIQLNLIHQNSQDIQTLLQVTSFFQEFLEKSSHHSSSEKVKCLETRIRDSTFKALDIIDSHVANQVNDCLTCLASLFEEPKVDFDWDECLFKDLDEVMEEIYSTKLEAMQIRKEEEEEPGVQPRISAPAGSSGPLSHGMTTNTIVGLDDHLKAIRTRLVSGSSKREIVAIVGMGGIGKTTLARKVYDDKSISSRFDTRLWVTVSQEYNVQSILVGLLGREQKREENNEDLGLNLYQMIKNRRYLIVLDDMWDTKVWDDLKRLLPNDENGSRILLTTRLEQVAKHENSCTLEYIRFLDDEESWSLFCEKVFGRDCCPPELEKVGQEIVRNCRGLPLAINVIGGHLSKATRTGHYWRSVTKKLSETITSEDDEQCSKILSLSYKYLPHHLKGCFLYMGIFREDYEFDVDLLTNLWIASGLIKQETSKSLKDVAEEYFLDLVVRNIFLVSRREYDGKILKCKIHDLIRNLCVKEAKNERFFHITNKTFFYDGYYGVDHVRVALHSVGLRALYWNRWEDSKDFPTVVNNQNSLRYIYYQSPTSWNAISFHKLVHLHTIETSWLNYNGLNIWEMPQLRVVNTARMTLADPPPLENGISLIVLEKLEKLLCVGNLIFTDEVLRRIPNVKELGVRYDKVGGVTNWRVFGLNNLERLHKLESLESYFNGPVLLGRDITFPHSIKELTLYGCRSPWEDMTVVGSLPNLHVLKLLMESFVGSVWKPNEGEFCNLKTLDLDSLDLVHWRVEEADHFPQLQHLRIERCHNLRKIPRNIGEILTLQLIWLFFCSESVYSSARRIEEEQHDFGNEGFQLHTDRPYSDEASGEEEYSSSEHRDEDSSEEEPSCSVNSDDDPSEEQPSSS